MFTSYETHRTFDRNIFNGEGTKRILQVLKDPVQLLFYFAGNIPVGIITEDLEVITFDKFQRQNYIPIRLEHEDKIYCGWVDKTKIALVG